MLKRAQVHSASADKVLDMLLDQRRELRAIVREVAPTVAVLARSREVAPSIREELFKVERMILALGPGSLE